MPAAIDRRLSIAASPVNHPEILIYSEQEKQQVQFSLDAPLLPSGKWTDYVIGVAEYWRRLETRPVGLKLAIASDVPYGSGLSSSAALEMAFATLIGKVWGLELDPVAKALKCQQVESDFVGMPCGIMDQFVVGLAKKDHFLKIDCQSNTHELIKAGEQFPSLLIINSNVRHALTDGGYASRRAQCESALSKLGSASWRSVCMEQLLGSAGKLDEVELRRGRHVISEMHRTMEACERIQASDYPSLGELLYQSHFSLSDDFEVSCTELDWIVNRMQGLGGREGVYGCRITGGGFGGCAVSLVEPEAVERVTQIIAQDYLQAFGVSAGFFLTQPSAGCALSKL